MKLYGYFRSSASYRVRIALNLKGLTYDSVAVHLLKNGGEQLSASFRALNPEALVPALVVGDEGGEVALSQSLAIIEYLEEQYTEPALLPYKLVDRAHVRALALAIACDVHPLSNLRVLKYLTGTLGISEEQKNSWYQHWCMAGLSALETKIAADPRSGKFCYGDTPSLADCCLVPQIYNAQRFNCDVSKLPQLMRIHQNCMELQAFILAAPGNQADAE